MILRARHHFFIYPFFKLFSRLMIKFHFHPVEPVGSFCDLKQPVLLVGNHVSWWDGFWALHLNSRIFARKFHVMMLEQQLRKYWYFNYAGGFSINPHARSVIESLQYGNSILRDPDNLLLIFPQGKIQSIYQQQFTFQRGIEKMLVGIDRDRIQVIFMANLVDYFSGRKPGLYSYYEEYHGNDLQHAALEREYNLFFHRMLNHQLRREQS
ncbi:MAG: hypothetical protein U0T82_13735 [Bacteroidales bacterium]